MKKLALILLFLSTFISSVAKAQSPSDLHITGQLTAACANANSSCLGTTGSTVEYGATSYAIVGVTVNGTYSGATINFEFSDDGGVTYYQNICTRTDANIQEGSEALPTNAIEAWDCGIVSANRFRIRASTFGSGTANIGMTFSAAQIEPAPTVSLSTAGLNACQNHAVTLKSISGTTSGNSATQIIALVAGSKIYVCSLNVVGVSGTTPTFSLVFGTGSNCATGQTVVQAAFGTTANTLYPFAGPVLVTSAGTALCYLDTGTTPVQSYSISYVQQ